MPTLRLLSVRLTLALLFSGLVYYTLFWRSDASSYSRIGHAFSSLKEGIAHPVANAINLEAYLGLHHKDASFNKAAHRIPSANDFLPHFAAVIQLPNLTMAEAKAPCTWKKEDRINYQFGESLNEEGWVNASWTVRERQDWELQEPRGIWQNWVRDQMIPYSDHKHKFSGRGIIIVGGNGKTLPRIKVLVNALRHLKSELPIEFHHYGNEITPDNRKELLSMWPKSYFNDLAHPSNVLKSKQATLMINYHLKTSAVINSRFQEVLLLDSDNIPTIKPEELFESETYKEYGTVFWPDMSRTRPNNPVWVITNTKCMMDEWEQESGQMLVDKRKFFYHLQLAAWLNNVHGQYWNNFILGDKDMFRFSWHALKTPYGTPDKWLTSVGMNSELPKGGTFYCGHTFAQHHPDDGRIAFLHGGTLKTVAPEVLQWLKDERGGTFGWYKRSKHDEDKTWSDVFNGVPDGADYMPEKAKLGGIERGTMCTDFEGIEARPFDELMPGFEPLFEQYGGYWQLDEEKYQEKKKKFEFGSIESIA